MCGGSIINEYFILTAAHCMHNVRIEYLKVRLGSTYSDRGGYMVGVANEFIHPEFDIATLDYDIAVLKLERALTFTETIQPINLPKQGDIIFSLYAYPIVTGWGRRNRSNSELSLHLIALEVPLLTKTMCQQLKGYKNINDRMICAGYVEGGKDSCIGDGGGPLVIGDVQIGIASWGMDCAQPRSPGVYAALPTLRYFIDEVLTVKVEHLKVRLGSTYSDRGGYMVGVAKKFVHPKFAIATLDYDIAVLKLERALTFTETIQPINLPKEGETIISLLVYPIVTGWGRRNGSNSKLSSHLIAVEVPLVTKKTCQQLDGYKNINDRMICAGYVEGGKDSCIGDGGGPLVLGGIQIGIASWGMDCAQPRSPGVYAALPTLRYFIDEVLIVKVEHLKVRLGSTYSDRGGYMVGVAKKFVHPKFAIATLDYDIAVLKLERALTFTETIQPINLPKEGQTIISLLVYPIVTGWGRRNGSNSKLSSHLIAVEVPLVTKKMCQQLDGYKNINDRMICAGYVEGGKDSCIGDGGGPLVLGGIQIGIASWGMDCAQPRSPGVYAALPTLRYFIDEVLMFAANN
ncbi:hypothetical protein HHI36_011998 [Cryptolaemus montrouzieri]|uniref:Peptidase S1 domain-containing protein n=1 Tax=Cryptolaemus montrouzieri TaxID=559131 RepID=A0ABD2NEI3_9CUCU